MKKLIASIPTVFTLAGNDYSRFLVRGGAEQMMTDAWQGVGIRLSNAIEKVGQDVKQTRKKTAGEGTQHGSAHRDAA